MAFPRTACCLAIFVILIASAGNSWAQEPAADSTDEVVGQLWLNATLGWQRTERLYVELDLEPKAQFAGEDPWRNFDATPLVEYYPTPWLDLTAEVTTGVTHQFDGLNTVEVTPKLGARVRFLRTALERVHLSGRMRRRWSLANLARVEQRNFWYSDDQPSAHTFRFRNRLEFKVALNRNDLSLDRTIYGLLDAEVFVPLGDEIDERYVSKRRVRGGIGYRFDSKWRADILYIFDKGRSGFGEEPQTESHMIDLRCRILF